MSNANAHYWFSSNEEVVSTSGFHDHHHFPLRMVEHATFVCFAVTGMCRSREGAVGPYSLSYEILTMIVLILLVFTL